MKHSEINWSKFITLGKQLVGKPYNFGVEVNLKETNPDNIKALDCSELIEWLFAQIDIVVPDGSYNQFKVCNAVPSDKVLIGDLGFKWNPDTHVIHHVGVYLGDNQVLEAKGINYGVIISDKEKFQESLHFARWGRLKQIQDA